MNDKQEGADLSYTVPVISKVCNKLKILATCSVVPEKSVTGKKGLHTHTNIETEKTKLYTPYMLRIRGYN